MIKASKELKIKAAISIQRFWRGIRTRQLYFKLRGIKAVEQVNKQNSKKKPQEDTAHKFYKDALRGYVPRVSQSGSTKNLVTKNPSLSPSGSVKQAKYNDAKVDQNFKKPAYLRQVTLARNKRARAINEK